MTFSPIVALSAINGDSGCTNFPEGNSHIGKTLHVDAVANRQAVLSPQTETSYQDMIDVNVACVNWSWLS